MRISAISFGNTTPPVHNHESVENEALQKLVKYWQETGDLRMAKIDFYEGQEPQITLMGKKHVKKVKPEGNWTKFSRFIKNLFKK